MDYPKFKVCVRCFTFNQSQYISDAMNGFVMQQTDFPYVCCIVDDASTDGEQDVLRKYVTTNFDLSDESCHFERETDYAFITYAQHKSNKNCFFAVLYLKENHYSIRKSKMSYMAEWRDGCEYEALCEGDDYWTDENKLQKQVDFLNSHLNFSLSHTGFRIYDEDKADFEDCQKIISRNLKIEDSQIDFEILNGNSYRIQTMTVVYRRESYLDIIPQLQKMGNSFLMGDTQMWLFLHQKGKIHFLPEETSVYRIHADSFCHSSENKRALRFMLSCHEMTVYMSSQLGMTDAQQRYFQRKYLKSLLIYKFEESDYQPFVTLYSNKSLDYMLFRVLSSRFLLPFSKKIYHAVRKCK